MQSLEVLFDFLKQHGFYALQTDLDLITVFFFTLHIYITNAS